MDVTNLPNFVPGKIATRILGVHTRTLYNWEAAGKIETIRTPGGKRLYNVKKYLTQHQHSDEPSTSAQDAAASAEETETVTGPRLYLAYIRVSSRSQSDDLEHQRQFIAQRYPDHQIIEDIGSGMSMNRRGLMRIIHLAIAGRIEELVVAYRDRLARFGFELINELIEHYSHGHIIVINADIVLDPEEEVIRDTLQIMNIFVAKMNGLRKYRDSTPQAH